MVRRKRKASESSHPEINEADGGAENLDSVEADSADEIMEDEVEDNSEGEVPAQHVNEPQIVREPPPPDERGHYDVLFANAGNVPQDGEEDLPDNWNEFAPPPNENEVINADDINANIAEDNDDEDDDEEDVNANVQPIDFDPLFNEHQEEIPEPAVEDDQIINEDDAVRPDDDEPSRSVKE